MPEYSIRMSKRTCFKRSVSSVEVSLPRVAEETWLNPCRCIVPRTSVDVTSHGTHCGTGVLSTPERIIRLSHILEGFVQSINGDHAWSIQCQQVLDRTHKEDGEHVSLDDAHLSRCIRMNV